MPPPLGPQMWVVLYRLNWSPVILGPDAPLDTFSEGRAMAHIVALAGELPDRQVGESQYAYGPYAGSRAAAAPHVRPRTRTSAPMHHPRILGERALHAQSRALVWANTYARAPG